MFTSICSNYSRPSNASSDDTAVATATAAADADSVLRRELEEKAELLSAAYAAMEALRKEREQERAQMQVRDRLTYLFQFTFFDSCGFLVRKSPQPSLFRLLLVPALECDLIIWTSKMEVPLPK